MSCLAHVCASVCEDLCLFVIVSKTLFALASEAHQWKVCRPFQHFMKCDGSTRASGLDQLSVGTWEPLEKDAEVNRARTWSWTDEGVG